MSASADPTLLAKAFDWLKARLIRDNELAAMSPADVRDLAADIGITAVTLRQVVLHSGDHSDLMDRMMRARGLDPDQVRHAFGGARDMEVTCALCSGARLCRRELDAGTAAERCHDFCGNAEAMDDLLRTSG